jgi:catechol 2,3-dioxygenase
MMSDTAQTSTPASTAGTRLPADAHPGRVFLRVADLARSLAFYRDLLGFRVVREADRTVALAPDGQADGDGATGARELIVLHEVPGVARRPMRPATTGLYHVALLVPSRRALGRALIGLRDSGYTLRGVSDHAVSESIYLDDPDGNGLEIYADRPRSEWPVARGVVQMTVDPMDVAGVLAAAGDAPTPWTGLPRETVVGHVHFTVAQLDAAASFYRDVVGFDVMMRVPTLVAVSAGGYHHHVNLNTWAGVGAPPDSASVAGLVAWELVVPDAGAREAALARLQAARDPDGVELRIVTA